MDRMREFLRDAQELIVDLQLEAAIASIPILFRKYRPDQPRVPAGNADGGQWTDGGSGTGRTSTGSGGSSGHRIAGKWNENNRAECEVQYESDIFQCRMMLWNPFCKEQARSRMTACMKGDPIPQFFHAS